MLSTRRWEYLNFSYWKENKTSTQSNPFLKSEPWAYFTKPSFESPGWGVQPCQSLLSPHSWSLCDCCQTVPVQRGAWLLGTRSGSFRVISAQPGSFHRGQKLAIWACFKFEGLCFLSALRSSTCSAGWLWMSFLVGRLPDPGGPILKSSQAQIYPQA